MLTLFCGTPRFMAPEVASGTEYDSSADVYSFGVLLVDVILNCSEESLAAARAMQTVDDAPSPLKLDGVEPMPWVGLRSLVAQGSAEGPSAESQLCALALAQDCCGLAPSERPTAADVAARLDALAAQAQPVQPAAAQATLRRTRTNSATEREASARRGAERALAEVLAGEEMLDRELEVVAREIEAVAQAAPAPAPAARWWGLQGAV